MALLPELIHVSLPRLPIAYLISVCYNFAERKTTTTNLENDTASTAMTTIQTAVGKVQRKDVSQEKVHENLLVIAESSYKKIFLLHGLLGNKLLSEKPELCRCIRVNTVNVQCMNLCDETTLWWWNMDLWYVLCAVTHELSTINNVLFKTASSSRILL